VRFVFLVGLVAVLASQAFAAAGLRLVSAHGVRLSVPAGWDRVLVAPAGAVSDPLTLLVVGTHGVHVAQSQCQIAAYHLPPGGAVVVVVGWRSLKLSGAAQARPGRAALAKLVAVRRPSFECFAGRGAAADLVLRGRAYQVNVMVGDRAARQRVEAALAIGRSFAVAG
jgi:hypothetical protein